MKHSLNHFIVASLLLASFVAIPLTADAQTSNQPVTEKKATTEKTEVDKPAKGGPFHGKLVTIDKIAKTITVGKRTFQITSESKLKKAGKPATLDDGVIGEVVSGYVKPSADGKLVATTLNFGPKAAPAADSSEKTKAPADKEKAAK